MGSEVKPIMFHPRGSMMGFASALPILRPNRRTFAFSQRVSPELCLVIPPPYPRGRREGRVPAGTRGPLRENVAQKNRTAAYRCSQSLGLPCAMVGRLMPCSPGSRTFLLASLASRIWMMLSARLGSHTPPQKLDRSNDG